MSVLVLRADARSLPLPDRCVDLVVTSPPYFGLRSYTDGGVHYDGQVGSEATPAAYVEALVACTREWVRVLKPSGSLFINLGDKYAGGGGQWENDQRPDTHRRRAVTGKIATHGRTYGSQPKSLLGLPWRYALACLDQLGLILRAEIIWAKPNGLPESVTDRVRRAHEQVFHFTVRPRYYSAVDEIREPTTREGWTWAERKIVGRTPNPDAGHNYGGPGMAAHPLGKLPGSVWSIPSQPLTVPPALGVDHFAAFPMELPRCLILGWSPPGVCCECGEGRRPVTDKRLVNVWHDKPPQDSHYTGNESGSTAATITGYVCACPQPTAPTTPAAVLDPFGGTGTTALLAHVNGRHGITVDRSADYCRIAAWRTTDRREIAAAMQVPRPEPVSDLQEALWPA